MRPPMISTRRSSADFAVRVPPIAGGGQYQGLGAGGAMRRHREALTSFLQRQASGLVATGAVKLQGVKVEVQSAALAAAANAALAAIPNALNWFGLTPAKIEGMIADLLPKQPAVAQAQAVAIDVANPATPSQPAGA
jgi:hypothetical protein